MAFFPASPSSMETFRISGWYFLMFEYMKVDALEVNNSLPFLAARGWCTIPFFRRLFFSFLGVPSPHDRFSERPLRPPLENF